MKKIVFAMLVCMTVFMALNAFAFDGSKDEAMQVIKTSLKNPQVSAWVKGKFGSETLFMTALKVAPKSTVQDAAQTFSDFQQSGGDLETAAEAATWIYVILGIILVALTVSVT